MDPITETINDLRETHNALKLAQQRFYREIQRIDDERLNETATTFWDLDGQEMHLVAVLIGHYDATIKELARLTKT